MKKRLSGRCILALLLVICLISSAVILARRASAEAGNRRYDIILDYTDLLTMSSQSDETVDYWLDLYRDIGVKKVAVYESTISTLSTTYDTPVYVQRTTAIENEPGWREDYPDWVVGLIEGSKYATDVLVTTEGLDALRWITDALDARAAGITYTSGSDGDTGYIFITTTPGGAAGNEWIALALGIWPETEQLLREHGMQLVPRMNTVKGINSAKFAAAYIEDLKAYDAPYYMNGGTSLLGFDDEEEASALLRGYLADSGVPIAVTETSVQSLNVSWEGFEELVESEGYDAVRVFNEWGYIQNRYQYYDYDGPEEIVNSLFRAVAERNCRVIYIKNILDTDSDYKYITDPEVYTEMYDQLFSRLEEQGFVYEEARAMTLNTASPAVYFLVAAGAIAAAVLLLNLFVELPLKRDIILFAAGIICAAAAMYIFPNGYKLLLNMGAGIVFPSLIIVSLMRFAVYARGGERPFSQLCGITLASFVVCAAAGLVGALIAASALSELKYMLEMDLYRGVKFMQLVPIGLFIISFLQVFCYRESGLKDRIAEIAGERGSPGRRTRLRGAWRDLLDTDVKVRHLLITAGVFIAVVIIAVAGRYYIQRTGHTSSAAVSTLELKVRNALEQLLAARPRTKEFIIGWPCLMLFVWAVFRRVRFLPLVFGIGGTIGLTSVTNTFLHIRTPLAFSLLRTCYGLIFGAVIGVIAVVIAELIYRRVKTAKQIKTGRTS